MNVCTADRWLNDRADFYAIPIMHVLNHSENYWHIYLVPDRPFFLSVIHFLSISSKFFANLPTRKTFPLATQNCAPSQAVYRPNGICYINLKNSAVVQINCFQLFMYCRISPLDRLDRPNESKMPQICSIFQEDYSIHFTFPLF